MGTGEEPGENCELGNRVVLHLVDHDVARVGVREPRARDLQVEPRRGRQAFRADQAASQVVHVQPFVARDHAVRDIEAAADQLERGLAHLFVVVDVHRFAERRELLVVGEGDHLVKGLVA